MGDRAGCAHLAGLIAWDRKATIGPSEMTSRITAIAEPKPTRVDSLMLLLVIRMERSSSPFLPWLMMKARSNARSDSMAVSTTITVLIGAMTGKTTRKKVRISLAPSTLAAQRRVGPSRSEEHTSELQSRRDLVCRLLLEKKKKKN